MVAQQAVDVLNVYPHPIEGQHYLTHHFDIRTSTASYATARVWSIVVLLLVSVGLPIFSFVFLAVNKQNLDDPAFEMQYGFLYGL